MPYNTTATTLALQQNPDVRQNLMAMLQQKGDKRSPEQWLADDLNGGDTNSQFVNMVTKAQADPRVQSQVAPGGLPLDSLVQQGTSPTAVAGGLPALNTLGGNYATNETGAQSGGYTSVGGSTSQQQGTQSTDSTQKQNTTGTSTGTQDNQGQQATAGASVNQSIVNTPFDLGALVNGQLGTSATSDANRNQFLTDTMQTGGQQFNSQVDQAVRQAVSGPGLTGAGDSAQARAAGYAGAQVARNNLDQRLGAASQLSNPNAATSSTINTFSPLFGKTDVNANTGNTTSSNTGTSTQNTTGTSDTTNSSKTMDLQNLISSEGQAGTATGTSASSAGGLVPQGQPVKSGSCVVCTAYVSQGAMKPGAVRRACLYKRAHWNRYGTSLQGYLAIGPILARAVLYSPWFARNLKPLARVILYAEVRLSAPKRLKWRLDAWVAHLFFDLVFWPVGKLLQILGKQPGLYDYKIRALISEQNLEFPL